MESSAVSRTKAIYNPESDAKADLAAALAQAVVDGKYVLVDFGANWCPECHVLDGIYHRKPVSDTLSQNFHLVMIDIGETKEQLGVLNMDLLYKYGLKDAGIPAWAILAPDGSRVATNQNGYFDDIGTYTVERVNSFLKTYGPKGNR